MDMFAMRWVKHKINKRSKIIVIVLSLLTTIAFLAFCLNLTSQSSLNNLSDKIYLGVSDLTLPVREGVYRKRGIMVPMRDGVRLYTNVTKPSFITRNSPVIFIRTTYQGFDFDWTKFFVDNGYVVVEQHIRGRFGSEGDYALHAKNGDDAYDTVEWIVEQPWSSGRVGTFGCSFLGEAQYMLAKNNHPAHRAMITDGAGGAIGSAQNSYAYFGVYENGVLNFASALGWFSRYGVSSNVSNAALSESDFLPQHLPEAMWTLPVIEQGAKLNTQKTLFAEYIRHNLNDSWWLQQGYVSRDDHFSVPALHVNNWFDQTVHDTFRLAKHMRENRLSDVAKNQHILVGPGVHCASGKLSGSSVQIGTMSIQYDGIDYRQIYIDWFDRWLKDIENPLPAKYKYFDIHGSAWKESEVWPPNGAKEKAFYLFSGDLLKRSDFLIAHSPSNIASKPYREFHYDPLEPVPTLGGAICCTENDKDVPGPVEQNELLDRSDILRYETGVLEQEFCLAGDPVIELSVGTNRPDTDFTAKLVDIYPDGRIYGIRDSIGRLSNRNALKRDYQVMEPAIPEEIYQLEIPLRPIAYRFRVGHRVGLWVSSSNFPRLARNLNTGKNSLLTSETLLAKNRVYQTAAYPSVLRLTNACP